MEKYRLLFESVFKRKLTDKEVAGDLEKIVAEYPYFAISQFYLLHLLQKDSTGYKMQAKKTAALFNNNYWLNFQLLEAGTNYATAVSELQTLDIEPEFENIPVENNNEEKNNGIVSNGQPADQIIGLDGAELNSAEIDNATGLKSESEIHREESNQEEIIAVEEQPSEISSMPENGKEEEAEVYETAKQENESFAKEEPVTDSPAEFTESIEQAVESRDEALDKIEPAVEEKEVFAEAAVTPSSPGNTGETLLFEPLHTSDYFASVGIKLSEEEKTSDKLGKQLKSFTDWLKTMKKVHAQQSTMTAKPPEWEASGTDTSIQKLAEKSNQENEVLTEAMADVLLQQGRHDKAIEILEKLSLLNPPKSAYFAAKINQIKEK